MKIILIIVACIFSGLIGYCIASKFKNKLINIADKQVEKFRLYYEVSNKWLKVEFDHYNIEDYFIENGYHTIAIYGMGELGNRLYEKLSESSIEIKYGIDKDTTLAFAEIDILALDEVEKFEGIDCIVVSSVNAFESVKKGLKGKCDCDIISLEDVVYGM